MVWQNDETATGIDAIQLTIDLMETSKPRRKHAHRRFGAARGAAARRPDATDGRNAPIYPDFGTSARRD